MKCFNSLLLPDPDSPFTAVVIPAIKEMTDAPTCGIWNKGKEEWWVSKENKCDFVSKCSSGHVVGNYINITFTRIVKRRCNGFQWIVVSGTEKRLDDECASLTCTKDQSHKTKIICYP